MRASTVEPGEHPVHHVRMTQETSPQSPEPRILVGATGSVAVTSLPAYLNAMRGELGGTYTVLMTHTATDFLPAHVVQLSAERVISGESPHDWPTDKPSRLVADHDILVVLPATAHMLSVAATGAAPNRLGTVILAANFPVVYFPSMGATMWHSPAVQRNIAQIREDGQHVAEPDWHDNYDVNTGAVSHHPTMPAPQQVAKIVGDLLTRKKSS
ncbi:flavoprotein [Streptomyces sp. NPDC003077]|uniref:flavoprotein n=1 Tax=Streptomyces sp. NPDC003077 TaxID=3154443 RepID=UPI00339EE4CF